MMTPAEVDEVERIATDTAPALLHMRIWRDALREHALPLVVEVRRLTQDLNEALAELRDANAKAAEWERISKQVAMQRDEALRRCGVVLEKP